MSGGSPSKAASPLSHPYTSLLSTLHERSSLLSAPSATIPPSLKRNLKRQIDTFASAVESSSASSPSTWREDARNKWERVEEALERDEEGRKVLLAARDSHPILLFPEPVAEPSTSDEPYRDSPASPSLNAGYGRRHQDDEDESEGPDAAELMHSQQRLFADQDAQLDTLSLSIGRQRDLSLRMNEELEMQTDMLEELDEDVERTGLRLGRASGQLERVRSGLKDHGSLCSLFLLIVLLVTLIILFK